MKVLGIESSCDETGIAVYDSDSGSVSQRLYSQIEKHREYGGVGLTFRHPWKKRKGRRGAEDAERFTGSCI